MAGLAQGRILATAEFRSGGLEFKSGRSDRGAYAFHVVTYNVEINGKPATYQERLPQGTKPEIVEATRRNLPQRGQEVIVEHTFRSGDRGQYYMDARVYTEAAFAASVNEMAQSQNGGPVVSLPQVLPQVGGPSKKVA